MSRPESREKRVERVSRVPSCIFDHYYSIQFPIFLPFPLPACVSLFGGSFHPEIENYAHTIYLFM